MLALRRWSGHAPHSSEHRAGAGVEGRGSGLSYVFSVLGWVAGPLLGSLYTFAQLRRGDPGFSGENLSVGNVWINAEGCTRTGTLYVRENEQTRVCVPTRVLLKDTTWNGEANDKMNIHNTT